MRIFIVPQSTLAGPGYTRVLPGNRAAQPTTKEIAALAVHLFRCDWGRNRLQFAPRTNSGDAAVVKVDSSWDSFVNEYLCEQVHTATSNCAF